MVPPDTYIEKIKSTHKTIKSPRDPVAKGRSLVTNDEDDANSIKDEYEVVKAGKTGYWRKKINAWLHFIIYILLISVSNVRFINVVYLSF